ncbi:MAG: polysaccharide deacetylase family protein [candidate division Zixibacteria bacterium]|nr:polysaccharide deacetylase family protein [candidate division Zixibacteria bacterium]
MKRLIKHILVIVLYYCGLLNLMGKLFKPKACKIPLILMYHQVAGDRETENKYLMKGLYVFQSTFDKQMSYLKKKYKPIALSQLVELLVNNQPIPENSVIITFDDGWRDNFQHAYPILKKYDIPATIFMTTDFIETGKIFWFLKAAVLHQYGGLTFEQFSGIFGNYKKEIKRASKESSENYPRLIYNDLEEFMEFLKQFKNGQILKLLDEMAAISHSDIKEFLNWRLMLNWTEINEMKDLVEIGSHGCSHHIMTFLEPEVIKKELTESKKILEEKTGRPITLFAYPNGDYNDDIKEKVRDAGYRAAICTTGTDNTDDQHDLFAIKRLNVHEGISAGIGNGFSKALFYFAICNWKKLL